MYQGNVVYQKQYECVRPANPSLDKWDRRTKGGRGDFDILSKKLGGKIYFEKDEGKGE